MSDIHVVVLAAGKGTRMKSQLPKVLHKIGGLTIIERVIRTAAALQPASITMVVGHGADEVKRALAKRTHLQFVTQEQQLGTGHALLQTRPLPGRQERHRRAAVRRRAVAQRSIH